MLQPPTHPYVELLRPADLEARGQSGHGVSRAVARGELVRLRRGVYVRGHAWAALKPEARQVAHARAACLSAVRPDVVCAYTSAAAAWGLPLFKIDPAVVHTLAPPNTGTQRGAATARHTGTLAEGDVVFHDGLSFTSLERTVYDVIRTVPAEAAIACADAAMRAVAWDASARRYDFARAEGFRAALAQRIEDAPGARGIRRARRIVAFMDGRAQLPGESVSRLYIARLGFTPPKLQVRVPAPPGTSWFVDFEFPDEVAFGEFDGEGKYLDPAMLRGRTTERALLDEKEREDWIRGHTNHRFAGWKMQDLASVATLGRRLAAFEITPATPRRSLL